VAVHATYMFVAIKWRSADGRVSSKLGSNHECGEPACSERVW